MAKQGIAGGGGTGRQGCGVVEAWLASGQCTVRVPSRNPGGKVATALADRGVELIEADLLDAASLRLAFEGAYGAFVVTNFWDPAQMTRETEIGAAAVKSCRMAATAPFAGASTPGTTSSPP